MHIESLTYCYDQAMMRFVSHTKIGILAKGPLMNTHRNTVMPLLSVLAVLAFQLLLTDCASAQPAGGRGGMPGGGMRGARGGFGRSVTPEDTKPRTVAPYFKAVTKEPKAPDKDGFIQRWMLLEPIPNGLRGNAGFTESYVREAFKTEYFPNQYTVTPKHGDTVTVNGEELKWHALDSTTWNAKLFRFAYGVNKTYYGITCFVYTVIDCPEEIKDVRMAAGSNSASMWWLNGEEAVGLFGDRRMVMDDCMSKRLTLKKGKNVIRGAVINGPGLSDFCLRFVDEEGKPVKGFTINLEQ